MESQGSVTLKRKGRAGRKPRWPEEYVNEIVQIICENEYYRRRLIFTNSKASKNLEIYAKIVNQAKAYFSKSGGYLEKFDFTPVQTRTKFKACVGICKKASMKRKCGSGITNFMDQQPAWFKQLFPFVESRDSCDPSFAMEPSFSISASSPENSSEESPSESPYSCTSKSSDKPLATTPKGLLKKQDLFVPTPPKGVKKDTTTSVMKEAVTAFNIFAARDPSNALIGFLKEENERNRQHEKSMLEMQMQMFQAMMASFGGYQQQGQMFQQQQASFSTREPHSAVNQYMPGEKPSGSFENNPRTNSGWLAYMNREDYM